jgi:hypothetical protein
MLADCAALASPDPGTSLFECQHGRLKEFRAYLEMRLIEGSHQLATTVAENVQGVECRQRPEAWIGWCVVKSMDEPTVDLVVGRGWADIPVVSGRALVSTP